MQKTEFQKHDYQELNPIDTPKETRRKYNVGDIYSNSIKCLLCNDVIRSTNKHDMVWCKCKNCAVDGGSWYWKITGDMNAIEVLMVPYNDVERK